MEAVKAWGIEKDGNLARVEAWPSVGDVPCDMLAEYDAAPVRIIREEDWERIETFLRDCANLGEHNAYSDGAAVGNIAERARVLYGVDRLSKHMDRNTSTCAQTQGG